MDNFVIVSGPALAVQTSQYQYLALLDQGTGASLACLKVDKRSQVKTLKITSELDSATDMYALLNFVSTLAVQYRGQYLSLVDQDALKMTELVTFSQSLEEFRAILNGLKLVVEARVDSDNAQTGGRSNSVRFTDSNVVGLAQIKTSSSVVMTIKAA